MDHDGFQGVADEYGSLDFACLDLLGDGGGGHQSQNDLSAPPISKSVTTAPTTTALLNF